MHDVLDCNTVYWYAMHAPKYYWCKFYCHGGKAYMEPEGNNTECSH